MSNYPDDVRNYDGDPRSPFCDVEAVEVRCEECRGLCGEDEMIGEVCVYCAEV